MTSCADKSIQIGTLAKQLGITTRTIRYYEEIGLMGPCQRPTGGARSYQRAEVLRLKFILKLKDLGISLKEMQELAENYDVAQQDFDTITPKLQAILDGHLKQVDQKIANLVTLRADIVAYRARIDAILLGHQPLVK